MPIEMSDSAPEFKFALGAEVVIAVSGEHGTVEGRDRWPESTLIT